MQQDFDRLLIVLPCHSLEDFPTHYRGADAKDLLNKWSALWHPSLLVACRRTPDWIRADTAEIRFDLEQDRPSIVLVPEVANDSVDPELIDLLEKTSCHVIRENASRLEIIQQVQSRFPQVASWGQSLDEEQCQDFFALGYAYLQVQTMTRQLRYSSNLDETQFEEAVLAAADMACQKNDPSQVQDCLQRCFDLLLEEKNAYYPVEPELIDVVLTASTTLGKSFQKQLQVSHPLNVQMTGKVARLLVSQQVDSANLFRSKIAQGDVTLVGGLEDELPTPLVASERYCTS